MRKLSSLIVLLFCAQVTLWSQDISWQELAKQGNQAYEQGAFDQAFDLFSKANEKAPKSAGLNKYMAQSAYRAGKFKEAATAYQKLKEENKDTWSDYNYGNSQFKSKDLEGAIDAYKEALRKDPNNEAARYNLTKALKQKQKNDQNQQNQDKQKENNPQDQSDQQNNQNQDKDSNQNKQDQDPKSPEKEQQGKLSREQTEQLLDALQKADAQAQKKLKDQKPKEGLSGGPQKDW